MMQEQWGTELEVVIRVIQSALAPAFLLVGISGLLNVITGRFARLEDRARDILVKLHLSDDTARQVLLAEQTALVPRKRLLRLSMLSGVWPVSQSA